MNPTELQSEQDLHATMLKRRLRETGMLLCRVTSEGEVVQGGSDDDWLAALLLDSSILRRALRDASAGWSDQEEPSLIQALPGVWMVPISILQRRRRVGFDVVIIPSEELLRAEQLQAMCQSARLDFEASRTLLTELSPAPAREIPRLSSLARFMHDAATCLDSSDRSVENVSQQLAESYEEISLLYTISQSMTVVQRPQQFINIACQGLLETLQYRWIGAHFCRDQEGLKSIAGKLILAGAAPVSQEVAAGMTARILDFVQPAAPLVIDPAVDTNYQWLAELGRPVLVHPVTRDGRTIGALLAGEKHGRDTAVTSADMKLIGATASHMGIFLENATLYEDMDAMFMGTLEALTASIDAKDRYTCGHSQRVAHLSQELARQVGLEDGIVKRVHIAGLVHDVGKIGVPEMVLSKPGRLTKEEFDLIKQHPEIGYRILKDIPQLKDVLPGVLYHHERWDGGGYPHGLEAEQIPLFARLIALADTFDAMSSNRTYRPARNRTDVLREIRRCAGSQFDPDLVEPFLSLSFDGFDQLMADHRAQGLQSAGARESAA